jgi:hypothetical protein
MWHSILLCIDLHSHHNQTGCATPSVVDRSIGRPGPYLKVAKPARPGDEGYTSRPYGVSRTNLLSYTSSLAACWPPGCWYMTLRGRGSQGTMSVITRCMQLINNGGAKSHKDNVYCFYMLFVCGFKISLYCILIIVQTSVSSRDVTWLIHNKTVLQRN